MTAPATLKPGTLVRGSSFFILMVRGLYDGAGVEAFFCLLAVVL